MANEEILLSLCAASVVAVLMRRRQRKGEKNWTREWLKNRTYFGAYYTLLAELRNLDVLSYRFLSRLLVFATLLSYIMQTGKLIIKSDEYSSILKVPFENSLLILFCRHVEKSCDTKLEKDWLTSFNMRQLVERNRAKPYSVQQRSTAVQHVEWHISTFNST